MGRAVGGPRRPALVPARRKHRVGAGRARARAARRAGAQARRWGYPARLIAAAEAVNLEPSLRLPASVAEVAWFPGEGYLLTEPLVSHWRSWRSSVGPRS